MKRIFKLTALIAAILTLAACNKEKDEPTNDRYIVYTVDERTTTVHLTTEEEFDALLESFCDYAESGSFVSFHNARRGAVKSLTAKSASNFSTTNRAEMKRWMRQMEEAGKTVTVTYDSSTGTYNGTAYAPSPQTASGCFTGIINPVSVLLDGGVIDYSAISDYPTVSGNLWVLLVGNDSVLVLIDTNGIPHSGDQNPLVFNGQTYHAGDTATICGTLHMSPFGDLTLITESVADPYWVDMGLPSGTLWARCNLGAIAPREFGDYFAWGETQPKDSYTPQNYIHCTGSPYRLTKYSPWADWGNNGYTDTLTRLELCDDAAAAILGGGARMPTKADWQELIDNTTVEPGHQGYLKIIASNGNVLYFPRAGIKSIDGQISRAYNMGHYWSSDLDTGENRSPWELEVSHGGAYVYSGGVAEKRTYGFSIRAVRPGNK